MGAAIKLVSPINEEVLQSEQKDYLLPAIVQPAEADTHVSLDELKTLLVEVRSLRVQLAHSQHMLRQREALLHNARVREQELRSSLFGV
jgi:hypothetical protein